MKSPYSSRVTLWVIVLSALLFGSAGGVLATALTTNYLTSYAIRLGEYTMPMRLSDERPRAVPQTFAQAVEEVQEQVMPSVAIFYLPSSEGSVLAQDRISRGVVLTEDGWILTMDQPGVAEEYLRVEVQQTFYDVERVVRDKTTKALFVKIAASRLSPVSFGSGWGAQAGDQLFIVSAPDEITETSVFTVLYEDVYTRTSESLSRRIVLQNTLAESEVGSAVADVSGSLVGILESAEESGKEYATVIPLDVLVSPWTKFLQTGTWSRAYLGVEYADLARVKGVSEDITRGYRAGALVAGSRAVAYGSPAFEAGIKRGDILLSVDGRTLDASFGLDEALVSLIPGAQTVISLDRDGEKKDITVTLGEK
jgi:serine protease Do